MDYRKGVTKLPEHMQESVLAWIERGQKPGRFLSAVFANDLHAAAVSADDKNIEALPAYARFLFNDAPSECFGSPELAARWNELGGLEGIRAAAATIAPTHQPLDI